ncbi:POC1 centriolar protein A [Ceratobasidium sp. 428]|nr:POC1 centriolar protein A [Ceratobasidium sp. 428]
MTTRQVLNATSDVALELLRLTAAAWDVFPPLKSAAEGALYIADRVKKFRSNKDQWQSFGAYVGSVTASVIYSLARAEASNEHTKANIVKLQVALESTQKTIQLEQGLPSYKRLLRFLQDPELIADMRVRVEESIGVFQLEAMVTTAMDVQETLAAVRANGMTLASIAQSTSAVVTRTAAIDRKASLLASNARLERLPHVQGASWDPLRACMKLTRVELIDHILTWARGSGELPEDGQPGCAKIMVLTGVAGAGKSTVAHTIARECHMNHQLGSSFFFDRETEERNTPAKLFSSVATDLSRLHPGLSRSISAAIENDPGLPWAPLSRQFKELVLDPCSRHPIPGPIVIVIDGLDEAWNNDLSDILCEHVSELPSTFRIFMTSRMSPDIGGLLRKVHVRRVELEVDSRANLDDMAIYAPHRLRTLAQALELGEDWPGEELRVKFVEKAEGLFQWVATVCIYLSDCEDPTQELIQLVLAKRLSGSTPEDQMNNLYARILEGFRWTENAFQEAYQRVMGTAIATKTPLTLAAMQQLHQRDSLASSSTLQKLGPLLAGLRTVDSHQTQPVRVLHQSLRDFLAITRNNASTLAPYKIIEREHSQQLALLCLSLLNRDLDETSPGTGYLAQDEDAVPGIPKLQDGAIPEALQYACRFWQDHVSDMESLEQIEETLERFLDQKLVNWMETEAAHGRYQGLGRVQEWHQRVGCDPFGSTSERADVFARACLSLSSRLRYEDRREEALVASEEAVQVYRKLASDQPSAFTMDLAESLTSVSQRLTDVGRREEALETAQEAAEICRRSAVDQSDKLIPQLGCSLAHLSVTLSDLGRKEEALAVVEEAVQLYREYAGELPTELKRDMAKALHSLSNHLGGVGRREEALVVIVEAVQLRRQLAAERPAASTPDLAMSLNNLSGRLSDTGRREEALAAIEEAVILYRQLAADRPAAFTPVLATSLNNLSLRLSDMGRREEALAAIEEAVQLRRQLAADRPAAFTPDLADSLNNLSIRLSDMGRREEALAAIEEAVQLCRQLAADRPAAFTPDLARSLNNLSNHLSDMGRREEALAAIEEAVQLYRQLAADRPAAFTPDLARSLYNLSLRMSDFDRNDEALSAIRESVMLRRPLAANLPLRYNRDLYNSLWHLSNVLTNMGRHEEAAEAKAEMESLST